MKCRQPRLLLSFVLLDDPETKARGYATRHWCADCLIAGRHITPGRAQRHMRAHDAARIEAEDPEPPTPFDSTPASLDHARTVVAEHQLVVAIRRAADKDPVLAAALANPHVDAQVAGAALARTLGPIWSEASA